MKVLIFGDVIIDKYIYGTSSRISPEAPVPVVEIKEVKTSLGGAGLVYENLKSLGVDVTLLETEQPRSVKTRIICDGHYVTRLDEDEHANSAAVLANVLRSDFSQWDYVILSDYNKGVLDESLKIIEHINKFNCKIIVDPKEHANQYKGAWLVKPNNSEFIKFGFNNWQGNIITTNAGGNVTATVDNVEYDIPVEAVEVSDVTGAGDCFLAAFVYGLTKNYNYMKCLELAIKGSRHAVQHVGTYTLTHKDIEECVIFTNGVFDIMHTGHFNLLKEARSLGDKLVVGINSDASVKRLKGNNRPVNNIEKRVEQISILPWVDEVHVFEQDTPYELIKHIAPNLIVKGGDYTVETVVGHELADVHIIPTVDGYSTTQIIENSK
jgi:D-beta-D-heptose 7-phosphate kinase/D-beta-D-heptose 1-phosphate adenosyltransferase